MRPKKLGSGEKIFEKISINLLDGMCVIAGEQQVINQSVSGSQFPDARKVFSSWVWNKVWGLIALNAPFKTLIQLSCDGKEKEQKQQQRPTDDNNDDDDYDSQSF